ncbi:hypothetical protein ACOSQ4_023886 [Xanthoceras sorbifolium]
MHLYSFTILSLFSTSHDFRFDFEFLNLMRENKLNLSRWITRGITCTVVLSSACHYAAAQPVIRRPPDSDSNEFCSTFDPSMATVILVLIAAFLLVSLFSIYVRNCVDSSPAAEVLPSRAAAADVSRGLDPSVIESFPIFVYSAVKDHKIGEGALECAVCLSEFEDDDMVRLLSKCDHAFHPDCIGAWLAARVTCPVCRAKLTPEESNEMAKSNESNNELTQNNSSSEHSEDRNQTVIQVNNEQNGEVQVHESHLTPKKNRSPRTIISGKFTRSHSTGHSLVQAGVNMERYTLRLAEEVRQQMIMSEKFKRARSFNVVLASEGSSRKGGGEGSSRGRSYVERWVFSKTPPFVSRINGSVAVKERDGSNGRSLLTAVKSPLNCLSAKVEQGESSSLRPQV